jgi:hypothetical protein
MEPQVGLVSGRLEQKEYGYKPGSRVYAGPDWGWQTQESYQKTIEMRKGGAFFNWLSTTVGDPIKRAVAPVVQAVAPVVAPAAEAIGGILESTPIIGDTMRAAEVTKETLRQQAAQRGVDPRVVDVGAMAAEELVGGAVGRIGGMAKKVVGNLPMPPGPGLAPVMAGGAPMPVAPLQPSFERGGIVLKATTSPEWTGPGMGQGVASTPKYSETVKSYMDRLPGYADVELEIERRFAAGEISAKRRASSLGKLKKKVDDLIATFDYDPENPAVYVESSPTKAKRATQVPDPIAEIVTGVPAKAHQHHYLAKAQTRPFINKLLDLVNNNVADLDDLVNFFTWPEKYSLYPGGVRKNMADLSPRSHISSESVTEFDRKYNTHRILQDIGLEAKGGGAESFLKKQYNIDGVTNTDELMQVWDQFLQEIGVPSKEVAKNLQAFFLTEYRKGLSGSVLKQFNEMAAKLYK